MRFRGPLPSTGGAVATVVRTHLWPKAVLGVLATGSWRRERPTRDLPRGPDLVGSDALELNTELVRNVALDDSDALIERFGGDASPEERAQARTSAPALIDTAPDRCCWPSSPGHRAPGAAARSAGIPVRKPPKLRDAGHAGGWIPHLAQCRHVAVGADATILHEVLTSRGLHGQPQAHAPFRAQSALR